MAAALKVLRAGADASGAAMAGASGKAGGLLGKIGKFAAAAPLVAGVGVAAFKVGQAFDEWFGISEKLADVIGQIVGLTEKFASIAGALSPSQFTKGISLPPAAQAALDAAQSGGDPAQAARAARQEQQREQLRELQQSPFLAVRRAAQSIPEPGAAGQGGTVKIQFSEVPRGTRITQTEGDPIDLSVGRQLATP